MYLGLFEHLWPGRCAAIILTVCGHSQTSWICADITDAVCSLSPLGPADHKLMKSVFINVLTDYLTNS